MDRKTAFQLKLVRTIEQVVAIQNGNKAQVALFCTNDKQEVCMSLPRNVFKYDIERHKALACRLLEGDKPVNAINKRVCEFAANKSKIACEAFALEHLSCKYIVFVLAPKEELCMYTDKFKALILQSFYNDLSKKYKKINAQRQRAEKYIENFAHLSHEFKTPLNVLQTSTQLLRMKLIKTNADEFHANYEQVICLTQDNISKLSRLTSNILDCVRAENGAMELILGYDSFVICVKNSIDQIREFASINGIKIVMKNECDASVKYVFDKFKLDRMILNLISNSIISISAKPAQNGRINVKISEDESFLYICVVDNGKGLSKAEIGSVFDSFYTSSNAGGTGLGLTVTKAMAHLHGGTVIAQQQKIGAKFIISISKNIKHCKADDLNSASVEYAVSLTSEAASQELAVLRGCVTIK